MLKPTFNSLLFVLLASSLAIAAFAQDEVSVHFPHNLHQISIPAEFQDGSPYIQVRVEGNPRPLSFTIDTGSSYTMLHKGVAAQL
jgi:hypothetical protein